MCVFLRWTCFIFSLLPLNKVLSCNITNRENKYQQSLNILSSVWYNNKHVLTFSVTLHQNSSVKMMIKHVCTWLVMQEWEFPVHTKNMSLYWKHPGGFLSSLSASSRWRRCQLWKTTEERFLATSRMATKSLVKWYWLNGVLIFVICLLTKADWPQSSQPEKHSSCVWLFYTSNFMLWNTTLSMWVKM